MRNRIPFNTHVRYRELWLRLMDFFPTVMMDMEKNDIDKQIIQHESYRYNAVVDGGGYMTWSLPSSPNFWEKAILPILAEYKAERITWSKHRYNPRVFLAKMPFTTGDVQSFRDWVMSGSTDTRVLHFDALNSSYSDDWSLGDDDYDYWGDYDDDFDKDEEITKEVEERFDRKAKRK